MESIKINLKSLRSTKSYISDLLEEYPNLKEIIFNASSNFSVSNIQVNSKSNSSTEEILSLFNEYIFHKFTEIHELSTNESTQEEDTINYNKIFNYSNINMGDYWSEKIVNDSSSSYSRRTTDSDSSRVLTNTNDNPEEYLLQYVTPKFLSLIKEEYFEFGYISKSEELVREQLTINPLLARNWINDIYVKYFSNENVLIGLLRILSRFEPTIIYPQGLTIALASLNHKSDEVKELGVRAFEQWSDKASLDILRSIDKDMLPQWLLEYVNNVIHDIEEQLCHY